MCIEYLCGTHPHRRHLWTPNKPTHACAMRPEVLKSWSIPELRVLVLTKRHVSSGNEINWHLDINRITQLTENDIIVLLQASQGMYSFKQVRLRRHGQNLCPLWLEILTLVWYSVGDTLELRYSWPWSVASYSLFAVVPWNWLENSPRKARLCVYLNWFKKESESESSLVGDGINIDGKGFIIPKTISDLL